MTEDRDEPPSRRSWFDKISQALLGEPQNKSDLIEFLREAQSRSLLDADAMTMIEGVLAVTEIRVRDVMIPRSQMTVIEQDWPLDKVLATVIDSGHSRLPVIDDDRDDVVGILIVKDLLRYFAESGTVFDLKDLLRPAKFIPESKRLNALLKEFRGTRLHMAVVVDEYGGVSGLVTIEDVLEQIVGEIDDEHDDLASHDYVRRIGEQTYTINALTPIDEFNEQFGTRIDDDRAGTIGGVVTLELGHVPKRGELLELDVCRFKVIRADRRRVHLFEMEIQAEDTTDEAEEISFG